ncbi:hypothetical protein [Pontibacter fetidus]|uniref:Pectate lyase n=1 Tax=Pontibacter fetidus TaxID=2700082 RepID=A0A6B2H4N4_9BACT|nr:hypothetical protein [Pontibacter fetidus]NDK55596.1 hypothetical protein [Pontibacter fetidus]
MNKALFILLLFFSFCFFLATSQKRETYAYHQIPNNRQQSLVKLSDDGRLHYGLYANEGEAEAINMVPDFSFAGYMGGGVALPDVTVKITLTPLPGDNKQQLQKAIDSISSLAPDKHGLRGKILLKAGSYSVNGSLKIRAGGVILSGEGQGEKGTILKADKPSKHIFILVGNTPEPAKVAEESYVTITSDFVPTGAVKFTIENADNYRAGDTIVVLKTPTMDWIKKLDMAKYGWTPEEYRIPHERVITAVNDRQLTINIPIVDPISKSEGGAVIYKALNRGRIKQSGIENLRLVSAYKNDEDEAHAWTAIKFQNTENCWVKNVTALYFGFSAVTIDKSATFNTVQDCAMLDPKAKTEGKRKYSFNIQSGSFNLIQRCYTRGGRHDFVTGPKVTGPNVFLDCYSADAKSDIGPHHRWATGTLFDNVAGRELRVINRKSSGTGHGWAGAQTMFWNSTSTSGKGISVESPPGSINWLMGGESRNVSGNGYNEGVGQALKPRSLYLAQLQDRLGPSAVKNVTIAAQRKGNLDAELVKWAGK